MDIYCFKKVKKKIMDFFLFCERGRLIIILVFMVIKILSKMGWV